MIHIYDGTCWVAECVQLNSGTENEGGEGRREREGEREFICKANGATWL